MTLLTKTLPLLALMPLACGQVELSNENGEGLVFPSSHRVGEMMSELTLVMDLDRQPECRAGMSFAISSHFAMIGLGIEKEFLFPGEEFSLTEEALNEELLPGFLVNPRIELIANIQNREETARLDDLVEAIEVKCGNTEADPNQLTAGIYASLDHLGRDTAGDPLCDVLFEGGQERIGYYFAPPAGADALEHLFISHDREYMNFIAEGAGMNDVVVESGHLTLAHDAGETMPPGALEQLFSGRFTCFNPDDYVLGETPDGTTCLAEMGHEDLCDNL
jgi:hypothetical protein